MATTHPSVTPALNKAIARAELVAHWMDRRYVDPIIGFILPGLGDIGGVVIGLWTIDLARQAGVARAIQARMIVNLAVDALVGGIPMVGDVFDLAFRAHTRNLELLKRRPDGASRPGDWAMLAGATALLLLALAVPVLVVVALVKWILA
jgi:Domain of unknown function (DUF4112)